MNLEKIQLLLQQSRFDLAETELQKLLASEPNNAGAYAMLSLVYGETERYKEAIEAAQEAIGLEPDDYFTHYVLGLAYAGNRQFKEAESAAGEARRMMPIESSIYALLAQINYAQERWEKALQSARSGLAFDPEHSGCANFEAMALVKLNRREESANSLSGALYHDPNNAVTHATTGWVALESGERDKAMAHFREALRLDPTSEYARSGIVQALKARNVIYDLMLRYFFWMSRLTQRTRMVVIFGAVFGVRILRNLGESVPVIAPFVVPIMVIYFVFVYLTWTADALFNLLLRLDPFGRLALSEEEKRSSTYVGVLLLVALACLIAYAITNSGSLLFAAIGAGLMVLPVVGTFGREAGRSKTILLVYTAALFILGLLGLGLAFIGSPAAPLLGIIVIFGIIAFTWISTFMK